MYPQYRIVPNPDGPGVRYEYLLGGQSLTLTGVILDAIDRCATFVVLGGRTLSVEDLMSEININYTKE